MRITGHGLALSKCEASKRVCDLGGLPEERRDPPAKKIFRRPACTEIQGTVAQGDCWLRPVGLRLSFGVETVYAAVLRDALPKETLGCRHR
jgi:hypothetical protein